MEGGDISVGALESADLLTGNIDAGVIESSEVIAVNATFASEEAGINLGLPL